VPVDCGDAWEWETEVAAVAQGAHKSATSPESIALVAEDAAYQVKAGYTTIVPWETLRHQRPAALKISPLAVVPQRNRMGRMILDLSFAVRRQQVRGRKRQQRMARQHTKTDDLQASVNDTTVRQAPEGPVKELGNVLPRMFDFMATVPAEEHIHFSKLDLADGYWWMVVKEGQQWNFAYVMPTAPGTPTMIVVPRALQMGWNDIFAQQRKQCATWHKHGWTKVPSYRLTTWRRSQNHIEPRDAKHHQARQPKCQQCM